MTIEASDAVFVAKKSAVNERGLLVRFRGGDGGMGGDGGRVENGEARKGSRTMHKTDQPHQDLPTMAALLKESRSPR